MWKLVIDPATTIIHLWVTNSFYILLPWIVIAIHIDYYGRLLLSGSLIILLMSDSIMEFLTAACSIFLYTCIPLFEQFYIATTAELSVSQITQVRTMESEIYDMCHHPTEVEILVFTSWNLAHKVYFFKIMGDFVTLQFGHTDPGKLQHLIPLTTIIWILDGERMPLLTEPMQRYIYLIPSYSL